MKSSHLLLSTVLLALPATMNAQGVIDALRLSQQDLKGTARYMSMGGAFGALGGDLTTLSQNPAGIGVYRSHEVGITVDLDMQNSSTHTGTWINKENQTKFLLNNVGGVLTLKLNSDAVPNLNFGFTYNKDVSFNRVYSGYLGDINNSMTSWIAGVSNANGVTVGDVTFTDNYDPYNPNDGGYPAPWISIIGYDKFLINPIGNPDSPVWEGQWGAPGTNRPGTSGTANYAVSEKGGVDSFNIAFGGNFGNIVYWGMDFDISSLNYTRESFYQESLDNAWVDNGQELEQTTSDWNIQNYYNVSGTGFTYKLGFIVRPIQELRIGFAFHTPTYYSLTQQFGATVNTNYNGEGWKGASTNDGIPGYSDFRFITPWKIQVSAAGVIGNKFIISAEYEWAQTSKMHFNDPIYNNGGYYDWGWDDGWDDDWYYYGRPGTRSGFNSYDKQNQSISRYFGDTNTIRIGAEYRILPQLSVRAGYSHVSSPVKATTRTANIPTAGTMSDYRLDKSTNYVTCGLGFRTGGFYADLAYVYKHINSTWQPYTNDPESGFKAPEADVKLNNSQLVLSLGYKF